MKHAILLPMENGGVALIDAADYATVCNYTWYLRKGYVVAKVNSKHLFMHRLLLGLEGTIPFVDHINGVRHDNRRANLRTCTQAQNVMNRKGQPNGKSVFKGVTVLPNGSFQAYITSKRRKSYIGAYATEKEAARAYDIAAHEEFGEFAYLNFPDELHNEPPVRLRRGGATRGKYEMKSSTIAHATPAPLRV